MTPNDLILTCSNWNDFFKRVSVLGETKEKGDVFEKFTQLYLQAAPKYRLLLKKVWKPDVDCCSHFNKANQESTLDLETRYAVPNYASIGLFKRTRLELCEF